LRGDSSESRTEGQGNASAVKGCIGVHDRTGRTSISFEPGIASREGGHIYEDVSGTLRANAGDNQMSVAYEWHSQDLRVKEISDGVSPTLSVAMGMGGANMTTPMLIQEIHSDEPIKCYDIGDRRRVPHEYVDKTPTLLSQMGTGGNNVPVMLDRSAYNQGENAKFNIGIDENGVAFTHTAKGPGAVCYIDTSHADDVVRTDDVVAPLQARDYKGGKYIFCVDQGGGKSGANVTENISPTLTCTHGGEPVICLQGNGIDRADTAGCNGKGWKEGTCYTLNTIDRPAVVYKKPHYVVRRLTPTECERLQGFPDGWTDIGEYIDSKGKMKKTSDTARYKALGNSIALPSWKWIVKRISALYERDCTLASLFDGIGGFPLLWEQINGKGSCIWASEIEDFPIAVTEVRINKKEN
jgi:DNA (cytosine-5)-methyltransferase 1